ncbi:MAG: MtnX-like HAD-IB family phosphatase [Ignavibacteriae bacterium]|nr:MtnX-like HAD-IB family phosphatase [Ignavibacteriota bacterium]
MQSEKRHFKFYVDFDGTISIKDIGEHMFVEFGDAKKSYEIIKEWLDGKISSQDVWLRLCASVENFDKKKFDEYLDACSIDEGFKDFLDYCVKYEFDVTIVSDGLDYYINHISKKNNFDHLKIFSNKVEINDNGDLIPNFPYTDEECKDCANCKRNHILNSSSDEDITIYIGDGWSDTCAAQHCDFIFAKRSLLKFCESNSVPYYPYNSFNDIIKIVENLRTKKKIKKRNQVRLKRRKAYMQG